MNRTCPIIYKGSLKVTSSDPLKAFLYFKAETKTIKSTVVCVNFKYSPLPAAQPPGLAARGLQIYIHDRSPVQLTVWGKGGGSYRAVQPGILPVSS